MIAITESLNRFRNIAENPAALLDAYLAEGKRTIGVFPYYAPEELVYAAGLVPFGIWGAAGTVREAGRYFPAFYCSIARMGLELALSGALDSLSGVIMPSICDTLRPMTQNFKSAKPDIPLLFLAHPQNRKTSFGLTYALSEYRRIKSQLEKIADLKITDEKIAEAIYVYNESRAARRRFVGLAASHPVQISPADRNAVLKSAYFLGKPEHTALLNQLNDLLAALPDDDWDGVKILTSGILADSKGLLDVFKECGVAIAADDIAQESRSFRTDVPAAVGDGDPLIWLAKGFAAQTDDSILYEPDLAHRGEHLIGLAKSSGAEGVIFLMMQFCDPEELDYPSVKKALSDAGIPSIQIGYDQQMIDFGQAKTQIETFVDILK